MMSKNKKVYIIAEAGVNHNGDLRQALRLVDLAKKAGADAVKFQTFTAQGVATAAASKTAYQRKSFKGKNDQLSMLRRLELDYTAHQKLMRYCRKRGIDFLSTPFDAKSVVLLHRLGIKTFKIPSGEITNVPHLRQVARVAREVILSTGMANFKEIGFALSILQKAGISRKRVTVLQCNTEYPTPFTDVNLKAMQTIQDRLGVRVGYSDHTMGIEAAVAAVAMGAEVIEKHFTLSRRLRGPDHRASLEFPELKAMVEAIRHVEQALGDGIKRPSRSEKKNIVSIRRSIVAKCAIHKGERLTDENLTTKRPAKGISPVFWDRVIGKRARQDFKADEEIVL